MKSGTVCHAVGDQCRGCAHYQGIADVCEHAGRKDPLDDELVGCLMEFLEPYYDRDSADLFAKLPGTEAQRVVRARKALAALGIEVS